MREHEVHQLYVRILAERVETNAFARDVFAETAVRPRRLRSAEDFYRQVVYNLRSQAEAEGWLTPEPTEIAAGQEPYFDLRRDGECLLIEPRERCEDEEVCG